MVTDFSFFPSRYWAAHCAEDIAMVWEKENSAYFSTLPSQLTWSELHQLIQQVATLFYQAGVRAQCLVAYSGSHRLCGLLTYCAALAMGAKILMLNPAQSKAQQQATLDNIGVDLLISDTFFAYFSPKNTACFSVKPLDFSQPATLTLTSGSTGQPKAVVHSINAHLASAEGVCKLMQFEQNHSWLLSLPLFHVSGQGIVWRWLLRGAGLYLNQHKHSFFDWLANVSHSSLVPTQLQRYLALSPSARSHKCLLGGANIPADLVKQAQQFGIHTFSGYGLTEMASTVCAVENELDNVGVPLIHREVKIEKGEIWVRGSNLALGYWQKNEGIRPLVNAQGWFQTRDRGAWNHQHQLVVKGRFDNMFISGGENIQPEEIEQVIVQSGQVVQVFVLPVSDAEFGHRPVALLQFKHYPFEKERDKLSVWLADKLEKFKQPIAYYPLDIEKYMKQGNIKLSRKQLQQDLAQIIKEYYV